MNGNVVAACGIVALLIIAAVLHFLAYRNRP
jgi:hypothetical protein